MKLHNNDLRHNKGNHMHAREVEEHRISVATFTAQHTTKSVPTVIRWVILPEFAGADGGHTSRYHVMVAFNIQLMPFIYSHLKEITYSCTKLQETRLNHHPNQCPDDIICKNSISDSIARLWG